VKAFAYVNPSNEKDAVAALKGAGVAMPIAGGQDLLARMKDYIHQPDRLVNVKNALEAMITATPDGGLKIGAAMKIIDLAENHDVAARYPAVVAAAGEIGTPQIRNAGTVGGNINQRPRCWYFRHEEFVCFRRIWRYRLWPMARASASSVRTAPVKFRRPNTSQCRPHKTFKRRTCSATMSC
jgi:xanthine dehydrogenase YagS FAD-binding subunit